MSAALQLWANKIVRIDYSPLRVHCILIIHIENIHSRKLTARILHQFPSALALPHRRKEPLRRTQFTGQMRPVRVLI